MHNFSQKSSLYKYIFPILLCLTTNTHPSTFQQSEARTLDYNDAKELYLKAYDETDQHLLMQTETLDVIKLYTKENDTTTPWNGVRAVRFAPQGGIFVLWEDTSKNTYKLYYFSEYTKNDEGSIHVTHKQPDKEEDIIQNENSIISMPIFSQNKKQAVVYTHVGENNLFLHISRQASLYKTTMLDNTDHIDILPIIKITSYTTPKVQGAISNDGELVAITYFQDPAQPIQLVCGKWEEGKKVMDNGQHKIVQKNDAWLKNVVNIEYIEENKKFQFSTIEKNEVDGKISFGNLNIYSATFEDLMQGELPDPSQGTTKSVSLDISSITNIKDVIQVNITKKGWWNDNYLVACIGEVSHKGAKREIVKTVEIQKPHFGFQAFVVITFISLTAYLRHINQEENIDDLLQKGAMENPHQRSAALAKRRKERKKSKKKN